MNFNAKDGRYAVIKMDDHYCLFTMCKINPADVPDGLHHYELRSSGKTTGSPIQAEPSVPTLYRLGSILSKDELPLDQSGKFLPVQVAALNMVEPPTVEEFLNVTREQLDQEKCNGLLYRSSFGLIPVYPHLDMYRSTDNLYMGLSFYDEEEQYADHFSDVTVNVDQLPYLSSTVDTNNNGQKIIDFLEQYGLGKKTEMEVPSGFCWFPVFHFNAKAIRDLDPEFFASYAKTHGQDPDLHAADRLAGKIENAAERAADARAHNKSGPDRGPEI